MTTKIPFTTLATICRRYGASEGLRCKEPQQGYRADLNGTPLDANELDAVVIYGRNGSLGDVTCELTAHGFRPVYEQDAIGFFLTMPIDRVDLRS